MATSAPAVALLLLGSIAPAQAAPEGTMTWGVDVTLASRWLDPGEAEGVITPFMVLYALHDALVKPCRPASTRRAWPRVVDGVALPHQTQRIIHDRVLHAPLYELGPLVGIGPRVDQAGVGLVSGFPHSAPFEEVALKKR